MRTVWIVSVSLLQMSVISDERLVSFIFPGELCPIERKADSLKRSYLCSRREGSNVSYIRSESTFFKRIGNTPVTMDQRQKTMREISPKYPNWNSSSKALLSNIFLFSRTHVLFRNFFHQN